MRKRSGACVRRRVLQIKKKQMGNNVSKFHGGGTTLIQTTAKHDFDETIVAKRILNDKLAPFYTRDSGDVNCSLCFLDLPRVNYAICCGQVICTNDFCLLPSIDDDFICPFCQQKDFAVVFSYITPSSPAPNRSSFNLPSPTAFNSSRNVDEKQDLFIIPHDASSTYIRSLNLSSTHPNVTTCLSIHPDFHEKRLKARLQAVNQQNARSALALRLASRQTDGFSFANELGIAADTAAEFVENLRNSYVGDEYFGSGIVQELDDIMLQEAMRRSMVDSEQVRNVSESEQSILLEET